MIDILIPVYYRAHRIPIVAENVAKTTRSPYRLTFIVEKNDKAVDDVFTIRQADIIRGNFSSYPNAMNAGYWMTHRPFVFTGVDDLEFSDGWDVPVMKMLERPELSVIGSKCIGDDVPAEGQFTSYFTVRRQYVEQKSCVANMPNLLFYPYYHHEADRELYGKAKNDGVYAPCPESVITHRQAYDEVQKKTVSMDEFDRQTYWNRRHLFRGA